MTTTFDYASASMAAHRVMTDQANESDMDLAADFYSRNEYVRQAESIPSINDPDFGPFRGAFLIHTADVDTDAGQRGTIGTADGRVVHTADTRVTTTVYDIDTRAPRTVEYVIPGGATLKYRHNATNGRKGGRPRKPDSEVSPAALRARKRRERQRTATLALADARKPLANLSAELVDV
jgi:hypothetical protein